VFILTPFFAGRAMTGRTQTAATIDAYIIHDTHADLVLYPVGQGSKNSIHYILIPEQQRTIAFYKLTYPFWKSKSFDGTLQNLRVESGAHVGIPLQAFLPPYKRIRIG
jgi:hypothetical protein